MIGRSGERGSGISVLAARHDDDDDDLCSSNKGFSLRFCVAQSAGAVEYTDCTSAEG